MTAEIDDAVLPYDVRIGAVNTRKGVKLSALILAAERWYGAANKVARQAEAQDEEIKQLFLDAYNAPEAQYNCPREDIEAMLKALRAEGYVIRKESAPE
jgi:hypothetical protein